MCPLLQKILLGSPSTETAQERGKIGSLNECGTSPSLSLSLSLSIYIYNCKCVQLCLDGKQQYSEEWRDEGKTHVRVISSSLSVSYELSFFRSFVLFSCIEVTKMGGFLEVRQKKYEFNILQRLLEGIKFIYACYFQNSM